MMENFGSKTDSGKMKDNQLLVNDYRVCEIGL